MGFIDFLGDNLVQFWEYTGFANCTLPHLAMTLDRNFSLLPNK